MDTLKTNYTIMHTSLRAVVQTCHRPVAPSCSRAVVSSSSRAVVSSCSRAVVQSCRRSFPILLLILVFSVTRTYAQNILLNNDVNNNIESALSHTHQRFHSDIRPFLQRDVDSVFNSDSLLYPTIQTKFSRTLIGRKLLNEDLLQVRKTDFTLTLNPIFNFEAGRDLKDNRNAWINTRGAAFSGTVGKHFSFESRFFESQAVLIHPLDALVKDLKVMPGQGIFKPFKSTGFDYTMSEASISYSPSRYLNIQLGQGKNFIGDGYRSLLLSDAAFSYPFLKITADVWILKYTCLYAQFQDLSNRRPGLDRSFNRKYGTFHYLSAAITPSFTMGFFEAIIWQARDSITHRGFDITYLNPVIFLRPLETSNGSPDNALMGINSSFKVDPGLILYGQLMLDEFLLKHVLKQDGWVGNKQAFQLGAKGYDLFAVKGLSYRTELNVVRPYTYSHYSSLQNYGHYNQPLAHPLGANFREFVGMLTYNPNRWTITSKLVIASYGADTNNINYGGDIFKSELSYPALLGNTIGQGLKTRLVIGELRCNYLLNPRSRMMLEGIVSYRNLSNAQTNQSSLYVGFAFKTSVSNLYYDFQ